jgi:hypothetical protein
MNDYIQEYMSDYKKGEEVAKVDTYKEVCKKVEYLKYNLDLQPACKQKKYSQYLELKDKVNKKEQNNYIGFFTLNFSEETSLENCQTAISNITSKKWMTSWAYSFEQRGEHIDEVKGIHIHLIFIRNNKRPGSCCSEIFNTYKNLQGRPFNKVKENDYKFYPFDFLADKMQYIQGNKWDINKEQKVNIDKQWRKKNKLKMVYQHNMEQYYNPIEIDDYPLPFNLLNSEDFIQNGLL